MQFICRFTLWAMLLSIGTFSAEIGAEPIQLPESFPSAMSFKRVEGVKKGKELDKVMEELLPYPVIQVSGFSLRSLEIRARWPKKTIIIQRAYGGGNKDLPKVWPGHFLYKTGSLLSKNITPNDNVISVKEQGRIARNQASVNQQNKQWPLYLTIYALDDTGKPDWSKTEEIVLEAVGKAGLTVKRGQRDTKPLAFQAGKAVVAGHMMFWTGQRQLNFSLHCPKGGPENLTAAEWYVREIDKLVRSLKADGVEFDVSRWNWGQPVNNSMDTNNDLVADYGYIDGVNSFGLGGQVFFRELRKLMGPDKLIQADSYIRGWHYVNGVQFESFPAANDFDRFSEDFTLLRLWSENAEALPRYSYPFTKTPTATFTNARLANGGSTDFRFRIGLAAAVMVGVPHPFTNLDNIDFEPDNPSIGGDNKAKKKTVGNFNWDEYHGGDLNQWQWLGKPIAAAHQELSDIDNKDLLAQSGGWRWIVKNGFAAKQNEAAGVFSAQVQSTPGNTFPNDLPFGVRLEPKSGGIKSLKPGNEYTLEFEARGDDTWNYLGQSFDRVPRMIKISGAITTAKSNHSLSVLADSIWRPYRISFTADGSSVPTPVFGVSEQIGKTEIRNIKLFAGGAERWSREFENGLVLLNMTNTPWRTSVRKNYYKRLKGKQAPEVNNGQAIESEVIVPARDALFLVRRR